MLQNPNQSAHIKFTLCFISDLPYIVSSLSIRSYAVSLQPSGRLKAKLERNLIVLSKCYLVYTYFAKSILLSTRSLGTLTARVRIFSNAYEMLNDLFELFLDNAHLSQVLKNQLGVRARLRRRRRTRASNFFIFNMSTHHSVHN